MSDEPHEHSTTTPDEVDRKMDTWDAWLRRFVVGFITLVTGLAMLGLLGVRTEVVRGSDEGLTVEVFHAVITRAGLATPLQVTVNSSRAAPLPREVTLRIDSAYLAMFDENGLDPMPVASYADDHWTYWTFEVPAGVDVLQVDFDARVEPAVQWGRRGDVAVVDGLEPVVSVEFRTWVIP